MDTLIFTDHIALEDNAKLIRQMQHRLNAVMKEVAKVEVLKLLAIGIIYQIAGSKWVSPI